MMKSATICKVPILRSSIRLRKGKSGSDEVLMQVAAESAVSDKRENVAVKNGRSLDKHLSNIKINMDKICSSDDNSEIESDISDDYSLGRNFHVGHSSQREITYDSEHEKSWPVLHHEKGEVKCAFCGLKFGDTNLMLEHYLTAHKGRRGRIAFGAIAKRDHTDVIVPALEVPLVPVRNSTEEFKCPACGICFRTKADVDLHTLQVHTYVCTDCDGKMFTLFEFTAHKCNGKSNKRNLRTPAKARTIGKRKPRIQNIFPKVKKLSKSKNDSLLAIGNKCSSFRDSSESPPPLVNHAGSEYSLLNVNLVSPQLSDQNFSTHCESTKNLQTPPRGDTVMHPANTPLFASSVYQVPVAVSPSFAISLSQDCERENKSLVLETKSLRLVDLLKLERDASSPPLKVKGEAMAKIEILRQRNDVSIEWLPPISIKTAEASSEEFSCGRCNVLCDDLTDFLDHIQECLHMTSVTMLPCASPPAPLLKLKHECSLFGFHEETPRRDGSNVNPNLLCQLQHISKKGENQKKRLNQRRNHCKRGYMRHEFDSQCNFKKASKMTRLNPAVEEPMSRLKKQLLFGNKSLSQISSSNTNPQPNVFTSDKMANNSPMVFIPIPPVQGHQPWMEVPEDKKELPLLRRTQCSNFLPGTTEYKFKSVVPQGGFKSCQSSSDGSQIDIDEIKLEIEDDLVSS